MSGVAPCPFCAGAQRVYLESPRWLVLRHADPVPIPGWMMLAARAHRSGVDALTDEEAAELGPILATLARSVREETGCARAYAITFNEAVPHLHLHVIPRHADDASTTSWALADRYRAVARGEIAAAPVSVAEAMANAVAARARPALERMGFVAPALP